MKLVPLEQWICDSCKGIIKNKDDGYVQFILDTADENLYSDFKIIHAYNASPHGNKSKRGCHIGNIDFIHDLPLGYFDGPDGIARLLSFIDVGPHKEKVFSGPKVTNLRIWVEFFRRLYIPYYEEARLYWRQAFADGMFIDTSEDSPYTEIFLKNIIEKYSKELA